MELTYKKLHNTNVLDSKYTVIKHDVEINKYQTFVLTQSHQDVSFCCKSDMNLLWSRKTLHIAPLIHQINCIFIILPTGLLNITSQSKQQASRCAWFSHQRAKNLRELEV